MRTMLLAMAASLLLATSGHAQDMDTQVDHSTLTLSGVITDVAANQFGMDYGADTVLVDMSDWDRTTEAFPMEVGDRVTVTGTIEEDLFEAATINADAVFVERLNTFFSNGRVDEEVAMTAITTPVVPAAIAIHGTVTHIEGGEFILDSGARSIRVDTRELDYDPFDGEGFQRIHLGDRVIVSGTANTTLLKGREIVANQIITFQGDAP